MFFLRYFLVLLQIVVTITTLNVLQDYSTLALTLDKRKWESALSSKKHLSVLFIYVLYAEKVKIEMFMICNLQCVDAALKLTTGNACLSRFFLVFISSCIPYKQFCVLCWTPFYYYTYHVCFLIISNFTTFFREISFTYDYYTGIEMRAWDNLLDKRILMYCM